MRCIFLFEKKNKEIYICKYSYKRLVYLKIAKIQSMYGTSSCSSAGFFLHPIFCVLIGLIFCKLRNVALENFYMQVINNFCYACDR